MSPPADASQRKPSLPRRLLDGLYLSAAVLAALCVVAILLLMMAQVIGREIGLQVRGADDLTAWFCAAASFLPLAHTFRRGELIRVTLWIETLGPARRRRVELCCLACAAIFLGFAAFAVVGFVVESWSFNERAQGMLPIPIWIPQVSFALGIVLLWSAVLDDLVGVWRGRLPSYELAERERRARGELGQGA
ncbi:MAG: TRAP transporter small permease [Proteobacteria bacterium]|nr:TRAP transporter small permease [Burkholderiales bacterium]